MCINVYVLLVWHQYIHIGAYRYPQQHTNNNSHQETQGIIVSVFEAEHHLPLGRAFLIVYNNKHSKRQLHEQSDPVHEAPATSTGGFVIQVATVADTDQCCDTCN